MASAPAASHTVLVCGETLPPSVQSAITSACDKLKVQVVPWSSPQAELPALATDPLLVIAGLAPGARSVPAHIGTWSARFLPQVPLCFFTEETLVRPSITLHDGALLLVGAPLGELRISALVSAWIRSRQRHRHEALDARGSSMVGGKVRLTEHAAGPHVVGSFVHETDAANQPLPITETRVGLGAAAALAPRALAADDTRLWGAAGAHVDLADSVLATVHAETRMLRVHMLRDDIDVRLSSPDRSPSAFSLRDVASAGTAELRVEPNDLLLMSWPRGAVSTELVGPIMLDGVGPLLSAFELLFRTSPSAFAAAAIQVR